MTEKVATRDGETLWRSWDVLKPGGKLVTIAASEETSQDERTRKAFFIVKPKGEELAEIARLIDAGQIRSIVGAALPLAEAVNAYQSKPLHGKVVLWVDAEQ